MLTSFHFHVSFYSKTSDCWDAVGWYFLFIALLLLRFIIPMACIAIALKAHFELAAEGSNAYGLLLMSHAFTCIGATLSYLFQSRKQVLGTY